VTTRPYRACLSLGAIFLLGACSSETQVGDSAVRDRSGATEHPLTDVSPPRERALTDLAVKDSSIAVDQPKKAGLVAYWKMDETSGTKLVEVVAGRNATRNTATGPVTGKVDNAQRFAYVVNSGNTVYTSTEYATVPHNAAFNFPAGSSFTITYWVKFRDCGYGFQDHIAVSKGEWSGGGALADGMWASGLNGSCKLNFLLRDSTGHKIDLEGSTQFTTETWHHVACVRDEASKKSMLYVDGVITDQTTYSYTGSFTNTMDIQLGNLINSGTHQYLLKGDLDEVAIFSRALSQTEINQIRTDAESNKGIQ
jgi:hypothetical protein